MCIAILNEQITKHIQNFTKPQNMFYDGNITSIYARLNRRGNQEQSRETGNIGYTRRRTKRNKAKTTIQ